MTFLTGIGILCGIVLTALAVYLIVRLGSAAYFRSLRNHQIWMSYAYWKKTFGFYVQPEVSKEEVQK